MYETEARQLVLAILLLTGYVRETYVPKRY